MSDQPHFARRQPPHRPKVAQARTLRRQQNEAETFAWSLLRRRQVLGLKFRHQAIVEGFIADFYCPALALIIELDGNVHDSPSAQAADADRTRCLEQAGYRVVRLRNDEVSMERLVAVASPPLRLSAAPPLSPGCGEG